ncbi:MAG: hypothetical protein IJZ54_07020 [Clostridia bacterium]|nr:hypothetical protein [Clostridia bacterium]
MLAEWTGEACKLMHLHNITGKDLAEKLNWTNRYLTMVLNCHRTPTGAEEKVMCAIQAIIAEGNND